MLTWEVITEKLANERSIKEAAEREKAQAEDLKGKVEGIKKNAENLASSSEELNSVSQQMSANAQETSAQATVVSSAAEQVSKNLQTVSTGTDEMMASVKEIAKNANEAAKVATNGVKVAEMTNATVAKLGESELMDVAERHAQRRIVSCLEGGYALSALARRGRLAGSALDQPPDEPGLARGPAARSSRVGVWWSFATRSPALRYAPAVSFAPRRPRAPAV
ncbi:MAG: hypothetical protein IH786_02740 [Proteobacteria bacterium]|nr:hypothetical protein [Pseudomonadota bacterium]